MKSSFAKITPNGSRVAIDVTGQRPCQLWFDLSGFQPFTIGAGTTECLDLLELCLGLYAVDRLVLRPTDRWTRHFTLTFPVLKSRLAAWGKAKGPLEDLVRSTTGDSVDLILAPADTIDNAHRRIVPFVLNDGVPPSVSLFSDGLDSFAGVSATLAQQEEHALVSVVTNNQRRVRLKKLADAVQGNTHGAALLRFPLNLHFKGAPVGVKYEKTQRSRSLVAVASGLTAAAWLRASRLLIHENGFGLLNLPLLPNQLLHESSQALHPANLRRWEGIAELLLGSITIETPNRFRTKAEMLARVPPALRSMISSTSSCDGVPRRSGMHDCGRCGSCWYRHIALLCAGYVDTTRYATPTIGSEIDALAALRYQASQWREDLRESDPWTALCRRQPSLASSISAASTDERSGLIRETTALIARHCSELLDEGIGAYAA